MFWGCKILILPKSNHFCPNVALILLNFAQISPKHNLPKFRPNKICPNLINFAKKKLQRQPLHPQLLRTVFDILRIISKRFELILSLCYAFKISCSILCNHFQQRCEKLRLFSAYPKILILASVFIKKINYHNLCKQCLLLTSQVIKHSDANRSWSEQLTTAFSGASRVEQKIAEKRFRLFHLILY